MRSAARSLFRKKEKMGKPLPYESVDLQ